MKYAGSGISPWTRLAKKIFRLARDSDAAGCLDIYRPFIVDTAVSFETEVPSLSVFQERIRETQRLTPWLVCEMEGAIAGYAYGMPFRSRPAYRFSAEVTVVVAENRRREGLGRALYEKLFQVLIAQGFVNALAVITLPNAPSQNLHAAMDFARVGVFPQVGYKLGRWHDTEWWPRPLRPAPSQAQAPSTLAEAKPHLDWLAE